MKLAGLQLSISLHLCVATPQIRAAANECTTRLDKRNLCGGSQAGERGGKTVEALTA